MDEPKEAVAMPRESDPGHHPPWMSLLVAVVLAVGAAYGGVHFVLKPMLRPEAAEAVTGAAGIDPEARGEIVRFEDIIVNPSGTGGSRYLSTTVGLEIVGEDARSILGTYEPMIKDALITHLSGRTIAELTDAATREQMRGDIRRLINQLIEPHRVRAVYFLDFVLQ